MLESVELHIRKNTHLNSETFRGCKDITEFDSIGLLTTVVQQGQARVLSAVIVKTL
jgi:hypothetical protein